MFVDIKFNSSFDANSYENKYFKAYTHSDCS